ncbi:hypothetical protein BcDW1_10414 [Botrytis cinerea BcDW1]|uniref:Uncharacterized protein n=1 Tax=Botryotinia fuckeliana (strain BcDW1) TaxID=1290391 RepID=M7U2W3_BOTF1|nr:hypothetical protein BcDW1_10414 [Botrytis cinerea BcDW1]
MVGYKDTYYIEVTLKEGFDFGKYDLVQAKMCVDGKEVSYVDFKPPPNGLDETKTKRDVVEKIQYANVEINGRPQGSKFVFWNMEMEKEQSKETGAMNTLPQNIPAFQFHIVFFESSTVTLSDHEYKEAIFFEDDNITKFPELFHVYDWDALNKEERKIAVEHLQYLEIAHWDTINGNDFGQIFGSKFKRRKASHLTKNMPREWRAWHKMYGTEQRETFDILQERRRARERGETHFRYISIGGDILLSGVEDESGDPVTALPMAKISNTSPHNKSSAGKEASALANSPYGKNILRAVGSSPDDMGANAMEPYAPTYSRMERMAIVDLINPRLFLEKESSVGIPDESLTQSTFPDITTTHRKKTREPIEVISLDSDDEIIFVSETKASKAVRHSEPARATKVVIANVDEDLRELKDLQKLREEKESLQRDIELLEKKRKMDEITKKIQDAEAKAKRIKTE